MSKNLLFIFLWVSIWSKSFGHQIVTNDTVESASTLQGSLINSLSKHDFLYAGEGNKVISIVKSGKVVWTYTDTTKHGEISDAILLNNGSVLFTRQKGVSLISRDKKLLWNYNALPNTEIHTARPLGKNRVIYGLNGNPAKIIVINILTGKTELEFPVIVKNTSYIHGQFRHISLTNTGTVLLANMDMNKVSEYDSLGNEIWSTSVQSPWYVSRLKNGNTLITSYKNFVREVDTKGETTWEFKVTDLPGIKLNTFQCAIRLENGNTILSNSCARGNGDDIQAIEISNDKKIVWALRSWGPDLDLGRSTTIQILDKSYDADKSIHFGHFK